MATIEGIREDLAAYLAGLDPDVVPGPLAAATVSQLAAIEKLAASARVLLAPRVAESRAWTGGGDRTAADWLARQCGTSVRDAAGVLATGERVRRLPETADALRAGSLSADQAGLVSEAATADPGAEHELLEVAGRETFKNLKERSRAVRAAATDSVTRERKIHAERNVRTFTDAEGAFNLLLRGPASDGAAVLALLKPLQEQVFIDGRRAKTHDTFDNRTYDAFMDLLTRSAATAASTCPNCADGTEGAGGGAAGTDSTATATDTTRRLPGGNNTKVIVNVDHTALLRGNTMAGETCEIAGLGPVPVSTVQDLLLADAFLAVVVKKGRDVVNVAHHGRGLNRHQRTALEATRIECTNIACNQTIAIQIDHRTPWKQVQRTLLGEQDPLCPNDHRLKTHHGWKLEPGKGRRRFLPPSSPNPDNPGGPGPAPPPRRPDPSAPVARAHPPEASGSSAGPRVPAPASGQPQQLSLGTTSDPDPPPPP